MGNCCSSADDSADTPPAQPHSRPAGKGNNFKGQGHTLGGGGGGGGSNNASAPTPSKPASQPPPPAVAGRTLSGGGDASSPKEAAARAAESRTTSQPAKGKLGRQLDAQKAQTQTGLLQQGARENVAAREADEGARARQWD